MRHALPLAATMVLCSTAASAHISLNEPARRYSDQKAGPCGRGGLDDGRTGTFSRFAPGQTITVRWHEDIDHEGSYQIQFDDDGADDADFEANVLAVLDDPRGGREDWEQAITLPDVECTNCTLRLVQIMTLSENPAPADFYFQCADLVLGDGESASASVGCSDVGGAETGGLAAVLGLLVVGQRRRQRRRQGHHQGHHQHRRR